MNLAFWRAWTPSFGYNRCRALTHVAAQIAALEMPGKVASRRPVAGHSETDFSLAISCCVRYTYRVWGECLGRDGRKAAEWRSC